MAVVVVFLFRIVVFGKQFFLYFSCVCGESGFLLSEQKTHLHNYCGAFVAAETGIG